jgi:hypothetical protein
MLARRQEVRQQMTATSAKWASMEKHATSHVKPARAIMSGVIVPEIPVLFMSKTKAGAKLPKNMLTRLDFTRQTSAACARRALKTDVEFMKQKLETGGVRYHHRRFSRRKFSRSSTLMVRAL